jgi:hypothetical protein
MPADVLHHAADDDGAGVVRDGIHVQLERILEEPVDEHGCSGAASTACVI